MELPKTAAATGRAIESGALEARGRQIVETLLQGCQRQLWKSVRDAQHLQLMGEAAGHDLHTKYTMLRHEYRQFAIHAAQLRPQVIAKLNKETPRRQKILTQAASLAQENGGPHDQ